MRWTNGPLTVYHGTDDQSASTIRASGINPSKFRSKTDFGAGFYVTTVLHQAEQWANQRCRRLARAHHAAVLQFEIPRSAIETLHHLSFIIDDADYHDFIRYCRGGSPNHGPLPRSAPYDIVYGPVSLWPQELVIKDCDQILFSNPAAIPGFAKPCRVHGPSAGRTFF